jgi:mycothiol system anti-sigma-R factor
MKGCDDFGMNIQLYLDKELTAQDREEFHAHLEGCPACRLELQAEEELSGLLHRSRPLYSAPDALRQRVVQIAELGPSPATHTTAPLRERIAMILARPLQSAKRLSWPVPVAAILLAAVGLLLVPGILRQSRAESYIETAVAAHRGFLNGSLPLEVQSQSPSVVTAWFTGKVPFTFRLPSSPEESGQDQAFRLMGGRLVNLKGGYVALVAYQMQQQKISLLVSSSRDAVAAGGEEVPSGGIVFHYSKQARFNVITWSTHGLTYALVSSLPGSGRQSCLVCHQSMSDGDRF